MEICLDAVGFEKGCKGSCWRLHLPPRTVIVKWIIRKLISNVMGANTFIAALNDQINVDLCKLYHKDKNNLLEIILFYFFIIKFFNEAKRFPAVTLLCFLTSVGNRLCWIESKLMKQQEFCKERSITYFFPPPNTECGTRTVLKKSLHTLGVKMNCIANWCHKSSQSTCVLHFTVKNCIK